MKLIDGDKLPTLDSPRLRLRWIELDDAAAMFEIFSDARAMRYWSTTPYVLPAEGVEFVESVQRCFHKHELYEWAVVRREDDRVIGTCTLAGIDNDHRRAEIGFMLRPECWGRGYMSEAVGTLLDYCFDTLKLHRIEADVDPRNEASIRLLERFGFRREGLLRERWFVGDEINDGILFGLLCNEYVRRPAQLL